MFFEICGCICLQDCLCEGNCVIEQLGYGIVIIGLVEKYIIDIVWEEGWVKLIILIIECSDSVGIIGVGLGGLVVVDMFCCQGV